MNLSGDFNFSTKQCILFIYAQWNFPTISIGLIHFEFKGCWVEKVNFITFRKQTVQNLIRSHTLQHLIWFCTVCRCPIKRMPNLNGLKCHSVMNLNILSFYISYSKVNKIAFNMDLTAFKCAIKLSSLYYERLL